MEDLVDDAPGEFGDLLPLAFGDSVELREGPLELLVADRKQGAPQRRKRLHLIVWPLDGRQRRAQRLNFAAIVE